MKEKLTNNLGLKILSVFAAFFLWLLVMNVSNPVVQKTQEVQVEFLNENILEAAQKTYEVIGKSTVTVYYEVRATDAYRVSASDFRVYADLAELYDVTGAVELKVEIANAAVSHLIEGTPATKPGVIRVETEELQNKRFTLQSNIVGTMDEDYAIGTVILTPEYVYAKGPESLIGQINSIGVEINVEGIDSDTEGAAKPICYDANAKELALNDRITLNHQDVSYQIQVLRVKNLNLDFAVDGEVAEGYRFTGVESSEKTVTVQGLKSVLANITTITVPSSELDITGAVSDRTVTVDVTKYLPQLVSLASGDGKIDVTLKVEQLKNKVIELDTEDIIQANGSEQYRYRFDREVINVTVSGLEEDLDKITEKDLGAEMNMSGLGTGTHDGVLSFNLDEAFSIVNYTSFDVEVLPIEPGADKVSENSDKPEGTSGVTANNTTSDNNE